MSELRTPRLRLRPYGAGDLSAFIALHGNPDAFGMLQTGVESPDQARRTFESYRQAWQCFGIGVWALFDAGDGRLVGECGLRRRDDGMGFALRYTLLPSHRGRGLAQEALGATIAHAFGAAGLLRIIGIADLRNHASCRVMERAGMALERVLRRPGKELGLYVLMRRDWLRRAGPGPSMSGPFTRRYTNRQ